MTRDLYPAALIGAVVVASILPARGLLAAALPALTVAAVALVLFLHGLRLSRAAMWAGATNWRLHLLVMAITFVAFPLLGLAFRAAFPTRAAARAVDRGSVPHAGAVDGPVLDRVHRHRARQRPRRDLRGHTVQSGGRGAHPAAGRRSAARRGGGPGSEQGARDRRAGAAARDPGAARAAVAGGLGDAQRRVAEARRSRFDPADRLRRVQRGGGGGVMAWDQPRHAGATGGGRSWRSWPSRSGPPTGSAI